MHNPTKPPSLGELFQDPKVREETFRQASRADVSEYLRHVNDAYWTWDELRVHELPSDLSARSAWLAAKIARRSGSHPLPVSDASGQAFWFGLHPWMIKALHEIDMDLGGSIGELTPDPTAPQRERYLIRSLMEEAIASSQIEGAVVTRNDAKDMLKTGRKPRTTDEQMVLNNYRTISWLRQHKNDALTKGLVFEIHRRITEGTLENPTAAGRLRRSDERIQVVDVRTNEVVHDPPPADQLPQRLANLCAFANADDSSQPFLHPVIRAIILHFWLAYDHPFVDGNGRTARALFYWFMLRSKYWLFEFLSISRIVADGPTKYVRAFLNTETDEADLTYFLRFHLDVIRRARQQLHEYLELQRTRNTELTGLLRAHSNLNHRQRALLMHAIRHEKAVYTLQSHRSSHGVTYQTARTDLAELAQQGFLIEYKSGRRLEYAVPTELPRLLRGNVEPTRARKPSRR